MRERVWVQCRQIINSVISLSHYLCDYWVVFMGLYVLEAGLDLVRIIYCVCFTEVRFSLFFFFFSSRRRHTRFDCDWSSDVCSSDLAGQIRQRHGLAQFYEADQVRERNGKARCFLRHGAHRSSRENKRFASWPHFRRWPGSDRSAFLRQFRRVEVQDRKSTRLNSSHSQISYAVFCLKKKK